MSMMNLWYLAPGRWSLFPRPCRTPQLFHFGFRQLATLARLQVQHQRPIANASNLLHVMSDLFKYLSDLAVAALNQHQLIPRVLRVPKQPNLRRSRHHPALVRTRLAPLNHQARANLFQPRWRRPSAHLHQIGLLNFGRSPRQRVRQLAVVGQQQQPFARIVQPAHRKHPLAAANQPHHRGPVLRIADGRYISLGLVHDVIAKPLRTMQQLAIHADMVPRNIGFCAQFGYSSAVDLHAPCQDEFLGLAPRAYTGSGQDLLQPLLSTTSGHPLPSPVCSGSDGSISDSGAVVVSAASNGRSFAGTASSVSASSPAIFSNSSMDGSSFRSFNPKRSRNSLVVLYRIGRPITCLRPAVVISLRLTSEPSTPPESTPRISLTSGAVTGCLYAITASVSSACKDSFIGGLRLFTNARTASWYSGFVATR